MYRNPLVSTEQTSSDTSDQKDMIDQQIITEYEKLNEKCDRIIKKIKTRKSQKKK
jgi:hypothetical protein